MEPSIIKYELLIQELQFGQTRVGGGKSGEAPPWIFTKAKHLPMIDRYSKVTFPTRTIHLNHTLYQMYL